MIVWALRLADSYSPASIDSSSCIVSGAFDSRATLSDSFIDGLVCTFGSREDSEARTNRMKDSVFVLSPSVAEVWLSRCRVDTVDSLDSLAEKRHWTLSGVSVDLLFSGKRKDRDGNVRSRVRKIQFIS